MLAILFRVFSAWKINKCIEHLDCPKLCLDTTHLVGVISHGHFLGKKTKFCLPNFIKNTLIYIVKYPKKHYKPIFKLF